MPLAELLACSDVVSVHTPLTPATRHLINADDLAAMKPGAYLINTARGGVVAGGVVDEAALIDALRSNSIRGALDVFEGEPQVNPELLTLDHVLLTPHTASAGEATRDAMGLQAVRNVTAVLAGDGPATPVSARARPPEVNASYDLTTRPAGHPLQVTDPQRHESFRAAPWP